MQVVLEYGCMKSIKLMKITKIEIIDTTVIPLMLDLLGIYTGVLVN